MVLALARLEGVAVALRERRDMVLPAALVGAEEEEAPAAAVVGAE
jgi:hypothetical protein